MRKATNLGLFYKFEFMEDSKLWFYIVLGAIYFLSKFLKKKKPVQPSPEQEFDGEFVEESVDEKPAKKAPSTIEEILRELSEQAEPEKKEITVEPEPQATDPIPKREPVPVETYSREARPIETYSREARPLPSQSRNIEAIGEDEEIDIVPHKPIERDKPEYKRSQKFAIKEQSNELAEEVHDVFYEPDGPRKAFILGEIFNRRY